MLVPPVSRKTALILYTLAPLTVLFYLINTISMRVSCVTCASVLFSTGALAAINSTSQALNTTDTNLIQQAPGGPVLYYNGSGNVPSYYETSPDPVSITPTNR